MRFIDIGANLGAFPKEDVPLVLQNALHSSVAAIVSTSTFPGETLENMRFIKKRLPGPRLFTTVGIHPTRAREHSDFDGRLFSQLLSDPLVVALGECGMDSDRLEFSDMDSQRRVFEAQLRTSEGLGHPLPFFLHFRGSECFSEMHSLLAKYRVTCGVAHSFTGTAQEAEAFLQLGLHIGLNGCSLKSAENLRVVQSLPLERILIETDAPYCLLKKSHAAGPFVSDWSLKPAKKGRNEPMLIGRVAQAIAAARGEAPAVFSEAVYQNTQRLFRKLTNSKAQTIDTE
jgi:TatD DNase family protein